MDDLRSRAAALLLGPCCISDNEPDPSAAGLIGRYVNGELSADPQWREQMAGCLQFALAESAGPIKEPGPAGGDRQGFYQRAAAMLQDIEAEVSAGCAEPGASVHIPPMQRRELILVAKRRVES